MSAASGLPDSGIAEAGTATEGGTYAVTELSRIRISPDNRKRFDAAALTELAASIKDIGVAQPILVRPVMPTSEQPEEFEIVAGERRYRASNIAGVTTIPTMIRSLTDLQAAKLRILENLQREDPHPMEEADGYQQLMLTFGYSADQLAEEVKKSRAYIYGRLKLCALTNDVREQFLDGKISASIALLIARIPLPKLQARALLEVTRESGFPPAPMAYRAAAAHIQSRYTLNLDGAVFATGDAKLMPAAGSCAACPKRSGNQPDLIEALKCADVCTDPDCFAEKRLIHFDRLATAAKKKGLPIIEGDEAYHMGRRMFSHDSAMVSAKQGLMYFSRNAPKTKNDGTPATILGDDLLPPPVAYTKGQDGSIAAWYDRSAMQDALEKAGACETIEQHAARMASIGKAAAATPAAPAPALAAPDKRALEFADRQHRAAKETEFRVALYRKLRIKGHAGFSLASLREFAKLMVRDDNNYSIPDDLIGDVYPFEKATDDAVCAYIDQASLAEVQMILVDLALGESLAVNYGEIDNLDGSWKAENFKTLQAMAECEGICPVTTRVDLEMATIALLDLPDGQLADFVRVNPTRLKELTEFVIKWRPHLLGTLEAAAFVHGFTYTADGFRRTDRPLPAVAAAAPADDVLPAAVDTPAAPETGDAADDTSTTVAADPVVAAPAKVVATKKAAKKATPAAPAAASKAKAAPKKRTVVATPPEVVGKTTAWPFPRTSGAAHAPVDAAK